MARARRLYIYFIAAVGVLLVTLGLVNLVELAVSRVAVRIDGERLLIADADAVRRQASVFAATVAVALPVWLLHWWWAERSVLVGTGRDDERRSAIRAWYLALVAGVALVFWARAVRQLIQRAFSEAFAAGRDLAAPEIPNALSVLLVVAAMWALHVWTRWRDTRPGPLDADSLWPGRLYLYGAAFAGAMLVLVGLTDLIDVVAGVLVRGDDVLVGERWWARPLAVGSATTVTGLLLWGLHWGYALRLVRGSDWQADEERASHLRRFYLFAAAFIGAIFTLVAATRIGTTLAREAFGVPEERGAGTGERLLALALRVALFAGFWLYHRDHVYREARAFATPVTQATVRRLDSYGLALVGLGAAAIGLARIAGLVIERLAGVSGTLLGGDAWKADLSRLLTLTTLGTLLWLAAWTQAQRHLLADPPAERAATTRRLYLYLVLAGAVVGLLVGLAIIIYRVLSSLLDVASEGGFVEEISTPLGVVLVALAIVAYHGVLLYREASARPEPARTVTLALVLSGPADGDLDRVAADLAASVPEGYTLRRSRQS